MRSSRDHLALALTRAIAVTTAVGLLLAACSDGESDDPSGSASPSATSTVKVPEDASLTEGGKELDFGDSATVVFEPNKHRGTVLELTVDKVAQGSISDFSAFILDSSIKSSTPYYVDVRVKNLGEGDVGGVVTPLYGVNEKNTLLQASAFTTNFEKCESKALPKKFTGGDTFDSCLVYLAPKRGTLVAVSYRPTQEFDPIQWTGDISKPHSDKPQSDKPHSDKPKPDKDGSEPKKSKNSGEQR